MNNNLCIIHAGYSYCLCTSGEYQITPAVLRMNIHKNLASLRVSLGFPHWLGDSPRCSQSFHNCSRGASVPVIRDPSYSDGQPECPPRVCFSPEIDASKFTLRLLSHTPGGSQWLQYISPMISVVNEPSQRLCSSLTLHIKLLRRLLAPMQQWYTAARPQSTLFTDFKYCHLQISRKS